MIRRLGLGSAPSRSDGVKGDVLVLAAAITLVVCVANGTAAAEAPAAEPAPAPASEKPAAPEPSIYDKLWGYLKLYNNPQNPYFQEFSIVGREQVDFYHFDGEAGDTDRRSTADNFANRR